jgi:5,6-dimethylbenzimidazole synthase
MTGTKDEIRPPRFDEAFRSALRDLILWRRDVRRFKPDPVEPIN